MGKGRGGGKTPERVVELIRKAVAEKSQSAVARESGLTLLTVQRYMKGIGEPSSETLRKLSNYFDIPVWELRGDILTPEVEEARKKFWIKMKERKTKESKNTEEANKVEKAMDKANQIVAEWKTRGDDIEAELDKFLELISTFNGFTAESIHAAIKIIRYFNK